MLTTVVLVDSEPRHRARVQNFLECEPGIRLLGVGESGLQAVELVRNKSPDLLILDISLPDRDGFAVMRELGGHRPTTLLMGGYAHETISRAFRSGVADFLVKPVRADHLRRAIQHTEQRSRPTATVRTNGTSAGLEGTRLLTLRSGRRRLVIKLPDINSIRAANSKSVIFLRSGSVAVDLGLKVLLTKLPAGQFLRVSRFDVVNRDAISALRAKSHGDQILSLHGGGEIKVSRTHRARLMDWLEPG